MRDVFILGSTGSIGTQALEVIAQNSKRFRVCALSAGGANLALLASQAAQFPKIGARNSPVRSLRNFREAKTINPRS